MSLLMFLNSNHDHSYICIRITLTYNTNRNIQLKYFEKGRKMSISLRLGINYQCSVETSFSCHDKFPCIVYVEGGI